MIQDGFKWLKVEDTTHGELKLVVSIPTTEDPWGVMAPLKGTEWEPLIRVISGDSMSHAMHGYSTPLARELGLEPRLLARKVPEECAMCDLWDQGCLTAGPNCRPGPDVPDCYEGRHEDPIIRMLIGQVVIAWRDGWYVVVVEGDEFSLR